MLLVIDTGSIFSWFQLVPGWVWNLVQMAIAGLLAGLFASQRAIREFRTTRTWDLKVESYQAVCGATDGLANAAMMAAALTAEFKEIRNSEKEPSDRLKSRLKEALDKVMPSFEGMRSSRAKYSFVLSDEANAELQRVMQLATTCDLAENADLFVQASRKISKIARKDLGLKD